MAEQPALDNLRLAILGTGTMGRTIAKGLVSIRAMEPCNIIGYDSKQAACESFTHETGVACASGLDSAAKGADVIIICVKPKDVAPLAQALRQSGALSAQALVISIAAGVSLSNLEAELVEGQPAARVMPNTPCAIGMGMTVLSRGKHVSEAQASIAKAIFAPLGRTQELEEKHLDTVTALCGSGPAFIYMVIESLADGAVMRGLPRETAITMAAQTVMGAAGMVLETGRHPASLKDDVTTPGGCTIAGLLSLEDGRLRSVLARAVETASVAAGKLAKQ